MLYMLSIWNKYNVVYPLRVCEHSCIFQFLSHYFYCLDIRHIYDLLRYYSLFIISRLCCILILNVFALLILILCMLCTLFCKIWPIILYYESPIQILLFYYLGWQIILYMSYCETLKHMTHLMESVAKTVCMQRRLFSLFSFQYFKRCI